jgi:hypothetical protein
VLGLLAAMGLAAASSSPSPASRERQAGTVTIKLKVSGALTQSMTLSHPITGGSTPVYGCSAHMGPYALGTLSFGLSYNSEAIQVLDLSSPAVLVIVQSYRSQQQRYTDPKAIGIALVLHRQLYSTDVRDRALKATVIVRAGGRSGSFSVGPVASARHRRIAVVGSWHCDAVA